MVFSRKYPLATNRALAAIFLYFALSSPVKAGMYEAMVAYGVRDYATALREFRPLAEHGDSTAQYTIGLMYYHGQGVPQDYGRALSWYKKAAAQGDTRALFSIARMYNAGMGVSRNYIEAFNWFRKAAERGHGDAQAQLGLMYYVGMRVPKDDVQSLKWLNIASSLGVDAAPRYSSIVARSMSRAQIAKAQTLANKWLSSHLRPR